MRIAKYCKQMKLYLASVVSYEQHAATIFMCDQHQMCIVKKLKANEIEIVHDFNSI